MHDDDDAERFEQQQPLTERDYVAEIPAELPSPYPVRIPSGYDPMGEIHLRGQAVRGVAEGKLAWWILITGLALSACFALVIIILVVTSNTWIGLLFLLSPLYMTVVLWRGVAAKRSRARRARRK